MKASTAPVTASFAARSGIEESSAPGTALAVEMPHGTKSAKADAGVVEELEGRRPLHECKVACGVLEHRRFVDHRELEVRCWIVDRDACVLGQQHHYEGDCGEGETGIEPERSRREIFGDGGQRGGCRDERGDENDHQQGGFGEEPHHHLAARPKRAEGGADVHGSEGQKDPRSGEKTHERDRIRCGGKRETGTHRGNDPGGDDHCAEHDVGRHPKQRRRARSAITASL